MSPLEWLNPNLHHTMRHPCNDMQHGAMQHGMPCIMPRTIPPCNLPFIASSIMPCSVPMAAHRMLVLLSRKELHARAGFICTTLHIRPPAALDQFSSRRLFLEYTMAPLWRVCRSCVGVVSQSENVQSHKFWSAQRMYSGSLVSQDGHGCVHDAVTCQTAFEPTRRLWVCTRTTDIFRRMISFRYERSKRKACAACHL